jgi:trimeric autotransporter adhesin
MRKQLLALALALSAALATAGIANADPPVQVAGQSATTSQQSTAASGATQTNPSNTNISIRVLSPGDDGNVSQTNSAASSANAANSGSTTQSGTQSEAAGGGIQTSQQSAATGQLAVALSAAQQSGASNTNVPVRVLSPGSNGSVTQTNEVGSRADAANAASTGQTGTQSQPGSSCGCSGSGGGIQTADQSAHTGQAAGALSAATQVAPSNTAVSVRVLSPGSGGSVTQSNTAASSAAAVNSAGTTQGSSQTQAGAGCGCDGTAVQQAQQSAGTGQEAGALSGAAQHGAANEASPVGVASPGGAGSVSQHNGVGSSATSGNRSSTGQSSSQSDGSGNGIQIAGQDAATHQAALAGSLAVQHGASNDASPVRVLSPGSGGSVRQSNSAASSALAGNDAATTQRAGQSDAGSSCRCGGLGIQVLGQRSATEQGAAALSAADQRFRPSECGCGGSSGNTASPVRVKSGGVDGNVDQSNSARSSATAANRGSTTQTGTQQIAGGGLAIQALGQEAATRQDAFGASAAFQLNPSNDASPVRVYSPGGSGSVRQSNTSASSAAAGNDASTRQDGRQTIAGGCGCGSDPIQVLGQSAGTWQAAHALSAAFQLYPSNTSSPTHVWSGGGLGSTMQLNGSASRGDSGNRAQTAQGASQAS